MSDDVEANQGDQTNHDGFAAMGALVMAVLFIVAVIVFAIA